MWRQPNNSPPYSPEACGESPSLQIKAEAQHEDLETFGRSECGSATDSILPTITSYFSELYSFFSHCLSSVLNIQLRVAWVSYEESLQGTASQRIGGLVH
jgi:hypothetical protein